MLPAQSSFESVVLNHNLLDESQINQVRLEIAKTGKNFKDIVIQLGFLEPDEIIRVEAEILNIPYFDENSVGISPEALNLVPQNLAERFSIFPLRVDKIHGEAWILMSDPTNLETIRFMSQRLGMKIKPYISSKEKIESLIAEKYSQGLSGEVTMALREETSKKTDGEKIGVEVVDSQMIRQSTVSQVVSRILEHAVKSRASDIHIEPEEGRTRIRYRIDGMLQEKLELPKDLHPGVISRIKILCGMKIDEKRIPQDGRFNFKTDTQEVDLRVSSLPTIHGEKIVMRLLDKAAKVPTLPDLGLRGRALKTLEEAVLVPHGIVLITGPTGSGKTTTLYSLLTKINNPKVNIVTLEDPVEYQMAGVNQVQVNPVAGLTFASGLRSFLRQDPNIIMVGEIRDEETADLAIQASLTGHLVFSTVHTNSASGALPRLIDMKAEPFLLASSITAIVGQRVVRRICTGCREAYAPEQPVIDDIKSALGKLYPAWVDGHSELLQTAKSMGVEVCLYRGKGCSECGGSGYRGRMGIYEVLPVNEKVGKLIMERSDAGTIETTAVDDGMILMKQDGYIKALEGITSIEEVLRVAQI